MRRILGSAVFIAGLGGLAVPAELHAQTSDRMDAQSSLRKQPVDLSLRGGYFFGQVKHPELQDRRSSGLFLEIDFGFNFSRRWAAGIMVTHTAMPIESVGEKYVRARSGRLWRRPPTAPRFRTGCLDCKGPEIGGDIEAAELNTVLGGARIEYRPLGDNGPFVAVNGGIGALIVEKTALGGSFGARAGYRHFIFRRAALSGGAGLQAMLGDDAFAWMPFLAAEVRVR